MSNTESRRMNQPWTPVQRITFRALALVWRGPELLMLRVDAQSGRVKGYRPMGGGVEFGETSEEAMRREIMEELNTTCTSITLRGYAENVYEINGATGHEIVAFYDVKIADESIFTLEQVPYGPIAVAQTPQLSDDFMVWRNPFNADLPVFPPAMLDILRKDNAHVAAA